MNTNVPSLTWTIRAVTDSELTSQPLSVVREHPNTLHVFFVVANFASWLTVLHFEHSDDVTDITVEMACNYFLFYHDQLL